MTSSEITARMPLLSDFYTDPFPGRKGAERIVESCGKCGGTGLYSGPTGWTDSEGRPYCFDCKGTGKYSILVSSARASARKAAQYRLQDALAAAAREVETIAFEQAHPGLLAWLVQFEETPGFLGSAAEKGAKMSPKMAEVAERIRAERAAESEAKAEVAPLVEGRQVLTGKIISVKEVDGFEGRWATVSTWKMTIDLGDGHRVFGTIPSALWDALGTYNSADFVGREVTLTATVERSRSDHTFGFFARPAKANLAA